MSETKSEVIMRLECLRQAVICTNSIFNEQNRGVYFGKNPVDVAKEMYTFVSGAAA